MVTQADPSKETEQAPERPHIDIRDAVIQDALAQGEVYRKTARVNASEVPEGQTETIVTKLATSDKPETTQTAKSGQFVVTNPTGEQYAIDGAMFRGRYAETDQPGVYEAHGLMRAVPLSELVRTMPELAQGARIIPNWNKEKIEDAEARGLTDDAVYEIDPKTGNPITVHDLYQYDDEKAYFAVTIDRNPDGTADIDNVDRYDASHGESYDGKMRVYLIGQDPTTELPIAYRKAEPSDLKI
jgi:hypothetical protein